MTSSILVVTIFVIGCMVGFASFRNNIVQEFGDLSNALESLDQSYSYTVNGVTSSYTDDPAPATNSPGTSPTGLDVTVTAPTGE